VTVNSLPAPVDAGGNFTVSVPLTSGANTITVIATDAAGNTKTILRAGTRDATAPVITVNQPADGATVTTATVAVTGTIQDASNVTLTVNSVSTPVTGGSFSTSVALNLGANTITLVATDGAGNSSTVTRSVTRAAEGAPGEQLPIDRTL